MSTWRETIEAIVSQAGGGIELSGGWFKRLRGPVVYVWLRDDRALYVGMSGRDAGRAFSIGHHRLQPEDTDTVLLYPAASAADAQRLERALIMALGPTLNERHVADDLAGQLGVRPTRVRELWQALGLRERSRPGGRRVPNSAEPASRAVPPRPATPIENPGSGVTAPGTPMDALIRDAMRAVAAREDLETWVRRTAAETVPAEGAGAE